MSLLVFGASGQVAMELARRAPDAVFLSRADADLADPAACAAAIENHAPAAVINAAAYTAVDKAEDEEALATTVNADAPAAMAQACAKRGIPFVHISTDYVFNGSGAAARSPDAPTAPINAYGRSKLAGEEAVCSAGGRWGVLRTSWVFSAHGNNFVKTMLRLSETHNALNIVDDQVGGPTSAARIAEACLAMVPVLIREAGTSGIYHFSGDPATSWADFARAIFDRAGRQVTVTGIPSSDYPTPAQRPLNSRLDCATLSVFGISRPDWRQDLDEVLHDLGEKP